MLPLRTITMAIEYRQWNERELEVAKGILSEYEARPPRQAK